MERLNYDLEMLFGKLKTSPASPATQKDLLEVQCQVLMLSGESAQEQMVMRRFFEAMVIQSLEKGDLECFEANAKRVIDMYQDFQLERSTLQNQIHSLYLLHLMVQNRSQDFHCHLEQLSQEEVAGEMVQTVLKLERLILQGNYKAFSKHSSSNYYQYFSLFATRFSQTLCTERTRSIELSYQHISF